MFELKKFLDWLHEASEATPHQSRYHQESLYAHTISVAYNAVLSYYPSRRLYLAALLHDIGKPETVVVRDEKGATFYGHENHLNMVKKFLTKDDEDYNDVCDLIRYHMLPYTMKGPEPWRSKAERTFIELSRTRDTAFMRDLLTLYMCDIKGTFSDPSKVPDETTLASMKRKLIAPNLYFGEE